MEKNMAHNTPPIITRARGFELSEPIPEDIAAGKSPTASINAVIITGLIRVRTPSLIAFINVLCFVL